MFLAGILSGIAFTVILLVIIGIANNNRTISGLTLFNEPGQMMEDDSYTVFQALDPGAALATSGVLFGMTVLLWDEKGTYYYDGQTVTAPEGKCFRQIGVFKYETESGLESTVPVVAIMKGNSNKTTKSK